MSSERERRPLQHEFAQSATDCSTPQADELESGPADDPASLLWQGADEREPGAEAVEAIRARRSSLGPQRASKKRF